LYCTVMSMVLKIRDRLEGLWRLCGPHTNPKHKRVPHRRTFSHRPDATSCEGNSLARRVGMGSSCEGNSLARRV